MDFSIKRQYTYTLAGERDMFRGIIEGEPTVLVTVDIPQVVKHSDSFQNRLEKMLAEILEVCVGQETKK